MIILGIDPGLAIVGFGVLDKSKNRTDVVDYGVITTPKEDTLPMRLEKIYKGMCELIDKRLYWETRNLSNSLPFLV